MYNKQEPSKLNKKDRNKTHSYSNVEYCLKQNHFELIIPIVDF